MTEKELFSYLKIAFENAILMGNSPDRKGAYIYGEKLANTVNQFIFKHFEPKVKKGA